MSRLHLAVLLVVIVAINTAAVRGQHLVSESMYGINTHVPTDAMLAKSQLGNIAWARIDINWHQIETSKGTFHWSAIDAAVSSAGQRGIHLFATLAYSPSWANAGQPSNYPPTSANDWKDFVRTAVNRYKTSIRHWGLWNEPDLTQFFQGSTSDYINKILIPGAQAIREADPTALRCGPELAGNSIFLRDVLNAAKDSIDVVTLHKYDERVSDIMKKFDGSRWPWEDPNYQTVLQNTGAWGKAVWFTEVGWPTAEGTHVDTVTEQQQAGLYVDLLNQIRQRSWINKIFFYELKDDPTGGVPKWGILNADLTEKPAYAAYRDYVVAYPPSAAVTITDLRRYSKAVFSIGAEYLADQPFTITSMPTYLQGCSGIRTLNADRDQTAASWIDFDIDREADVYVAYDPRASSLPDWLSSYTEMGEVIGVSDTAQDHARLFRKVLPMGEVVLGANMGAGAAGAGSNYFVLVIPSGVGPPGAATNPYPADQAVRVPRSVQLGWTPAAGATSHDVYLGKSPPGVLLGNQAGTVFDPQPLEVNTTYFWRIDEVNSAGSSRGRVWSFTTAPSPGDADMDGDVDQEDFGQLQLCLTGLDGQLGPECLFADINGDGAAQQKDVVLFLGCLSGADVPADPDCVK
jgi:hypothetical protein